jgi:two-component system, OmpR family, sensor histidine kinase VicK
MVSYIDYLHSIVSATVNTSAVLLADTEWPTAYHRYLMVIYSNAQRLADLLVDINFLAYLETDITAAAYLSHELRTPLGSMIGYAELILGKSESGEGPALNEQFQEKIERIKRNNRLLLEHINDLIDYGSLVRGKRTPWMAIFDLSAVLARLKKYYDFGIPSDNRMLQLYADEDRTQQTIRILLGQLVKRKQKQEIQIAVASPEVNMIEIVISCSDAFDSNNEIDKLFESSYAFEQHDLELLIAKMQIELQKGTLSIDNDPDSGIKFIVRLPNNLSETIS